jgi:hypothetical protein
MPKAANRTEREPVVLRWHPGTFAGALFDAELNWHTGQELLGWAARGIDFIVLDHETGEDITQVFLAHWQDGQVIDPIGEKQRGR